MTAVGDLAAAAGRCLGVAVRAVAPVDGFAGGQIVRISTDDGDYFVKAGAAAETSAEAWACRTARDLGVPAPEVVDVDVSREVLDRPFLVMRPVAGAPLAHPDQPDDAAVLIQAGGALRRIHEIELAGFGWLGSSDGTVVPSGPSATWREVVAAMLSGIGAQVDAGVLPRELASGVESRMAADAEHLSFAGPGRLLHADMHLRHVYGEGDALTGIIDWGDVTAGDPLFDLAVVSLAGRVALDALLGGYGPVDPGRDVPRVLHLYAITYAVQASTLELRAGGQTFAHRVEWIRRRLDRLDQLDASR